MRGDETESEKQKRWQIFNMWIYSGRQKWAMTSDAAGKRPVVILIQTCDAAEEESQKHDSRRDQCSKLMERDSIDLIRNTPGKPDD